MNLAESLRLLIWTVWSPARAFRVLQTDPRCLVAFLVIGLGSALISWWTIPVVQSASRRLMSQTLSTEQEQYVASVNKIAHYAGTLGAPLVTLVSWFAAAFLIWMIAQVFAGLPGFRAVFSVVAHASVASLVSGILVALILFIKLQSDAVSSQDLEIRLGLDLFWDGQLHPALGVVLGSVNPLNLWYYGLLVMGIRAVCAFTYLRSFAVIGTLWAISTAFGAGIAWVAGSLAATPSL